MHYALHGAAPFFYHLVNVIFHAANVLLVYALASRLLGSTFAAVGAALIFGLHPVQTEAVNGIVGRAELMSAFWVLLAWVLYIRSGVGRGERLNRFYSLSLTAAFLGMLSKENAACTVGWRVSSSAASSCSCCDAVATGSPMNSIIHVLLMVGLAARNRLW